MILGQHPVPGAHDGRIEYHDPDLGQPMDLQDRASVVSFTQQFRVEHRPYVVVARRVDDLGSNRFQCPVQAPVGVGIAGVGQIPGHDDEIGPATFRSCPEQREVPPPGRGRRPGRSRRCTERRGWSDGYPRDAR